MQNHFSQQRHELVSIIRSKGISDEQVLQAIERVPRHLFVPQAYIDEAYEDYPVPIGEGQTVSQPFTVAFMTQLLQVQPGNKVLEIGTGSGYQAAVLAELGAEVYTVERIFSLHQRSAELLKSLGYQNIHTFFGDGTEGLQEFAPFDRIIITAAGPLQENLLDQLKVNGIMVAPIDEGFGYSTMIKLTKTGANRDYQIERYPGFSFVPLLKGIERS